jgi:hypothetical protein
MPHSRTIIRHAVATLLRNASTAVGERVYTTRVDPYRRPELPALAVYTLDEASEVVEGSAPRELKRTLQLAVEAEVAMSRNVDDVLDDLALQIELALHQDETWGGVAEDSHLDSTEIQVLGEQDKQVGVVRMVYQVTYCSDVPAVPPELPRFLRASINHDASGATASDDVEV